MFVLALRLSHERADDDMSFLSLATGRLLDRLLQVERDVPVSVCSRRSLLSSDHRGGTEPGVTFRTLDHSAPLHYAGRRILRDNTATNDLSGDEGRLSSYHRLR